MLHVYKTVNDSGKGGVPLTHIASVRTWRETHAPRAAAHIEAVLWKHSCITYVYSDSGEMLTKQTQRGTL
jgi:hypothetical protein